ncbi:MAG: ABC transporter permease [Haloglomus sp.]
MSSRRRAGAALVASARQYARTPVLLALLVAVPAYLVAVVGRVVPDARVPLYGVAGGTTADAAAAFGTLMAPLAVALVAGIAGLFLADRADVDRRLVVAGYRPWQLLAGRVGVLVGVTLLASVATLAALATVRVPDQPAAFAVALLLAGLGYGGVGALAGAALDRLPGTYVMLFAPTLDGFLVQSPLTRGGSSLASYLPAGAPVELAMAAAYGTPDISVALRGLTVAALFAAAATVVLYWRLPRD